MTDRLTVAHPDGAGQGRVGDQAAHQQVVLLPSPVAPEVWIPSPLHIGSPEHLAALAAGSSAHNSGALLGQRLFEHARSGHHSFPVASYPDAEDWAVGRMADHCAVYRHARREPAAAETARAWLSELAIRKPIRLPLYDDFYAPSSVLRVSPMPNAGPSEPAGLTLETPAPELGGFVGLQQRPAGFAATTVWHGDLEPFVREVLDALEPSRGSAVWILQLQAEPPQAAAAHPRLQLGAELSLRPDPFFPGCQRYVRADGYASRLREAAQAIRCTPAMLETHLLPECYGRIVDVASYGS